MDTNMKQQKTRSMSYHWHLETLQLRGKNAFINGWCFIPGKEILKLELQLRDASNSLVGAIPLQASTIRPDVQQEFKLEKNALHSGFVGIGSWPRRPGLRDQLVIAGLMGDKEQLEIKIPHSSLEKFLTPNRWHKRKLAFLLWIRYIGKAIHLLTNGQLGVLNDKLKRQLNAAPQKKMPEIISWNMIKSIGGNPEAGVHLVVDHRLGGGANQYRERLIISWLEAGATVFILCNYIAKLQIMLIVRTNQHELRLSLENESDLLIALQQISVSTITYNTAVSFLQAELLPELLLNLRRTHRSHLTVLIHDFFIVCPSHFLIHADGYFCNIPELNTCKDCLHRNPHGFTSLFQADVTKWRNAWGPLLKEADEIIAFSESSIFLLRQAYETWQDGTNWLQGRKITLTPHAAVSLKNNNIVINQIENMVIGIVGQIDFHKGAQIVRNLTQEILRQKTSERIVIIGDLEGQIDVPIISQTGRYNNSELPSIIEKCGVNIILFPSIWPETFSYVTQEIIQCGLPIACFDLGAPAERIKKYEKGVVLDSQAACSILKGLRNHFQTIYPK